MLKLNYKPVVLTLAVFNRSQKEAIAFGGKRICLINDNTMICSFFFLYINFSVSDFKFQKYFWIIYFNNYQRNWTRIANQVSFREIELFHTE